MPRLSYAEQLKDPRWQRKRLERLAASDWKCKVCGDATKPLNVHHKIYVRGRLPWEYSGDELDVLCEDCHAAEHGLVAAGSRRVSAGAGSASRVAIRGPADRALWMLLLESSWWMVLTDEDRGQLRVEPGWRGAAFTFIGRAVDSHGAEPWAVLRERMSVEPWAGEALALVDGEDPTIEPRREDLEAAVWNVIRARNAAIHARILGRI